MFHTKDIAFYPRVKVESSKEYGDLPVFAGSDIKDLSKKEALAEIEEDLRVALSLYRSANGESARAVRSVLRHSMRVLGYEIYSLTKDTDVMSDIAGRLEPYGSVLDKLWDGIGNWAA